jgi:hypothetical protein
VSGKSSAVLHPSGQAAIALLAHPNDAIKANNTTFFFMSVFFYHNTANRALRTA